VQCIVESDQIYVRFLNRSNPDLSKFGCWWVHGWGSWVFQHFPLLARWNWPSGILYLPHVVPVWQKISPSTHGHHDRWQQMHLWDLWERDFNWLVKIGKQLLTSTDLHCSCWFLLKSRNLQETLESSWDSDGLWRNEGATGVPRVWSALSESHEKGPHYWEKSPLQMSSEQNARSSISYPYRPLIPPQFLRILTILILCHG